MDDLTIPLLIERHAKYNVVPHRQRLAPPVLRHIGDLAATIAVTRLHIHVAQDGREQGGLASTHAADHGDDLSRAHGELRHVELEATVASVCEDTVALHRDKHTGRRGLGFRVGGCVKTPSYAGQGQTSKRRGLGFRVRLNFRF